MTSQSTSRVISSGSKDKPSLAIALAAVVVVFLAYSSPLSAEWFGDSQAHMGTEVSVYLWHDDAEKGQKAVEAVFAEVARLDQLMSTYKEDSEISAINRNAAKQPVVTGDELFALIRRSLDISVLTLGAFDITYDSVGQHYDFREGRRPSEETIASELGHINYRYVETDRGRKTIFFAQQGVRINLGGIAKGYAVERGIYIAKRFGVRHARVTAGGDTRLLGDRRGQPWMVGIRDPRVEDKVAVTIPLENEAISTSGDYERFFIEDGERYHHIIVPSTGVPAGEVHSATIIGPDAVLTDALSTSVFVMGVDQGLRLIATLPDYEGIVIDAAGQMFYSDGLGSPD
jgi:thiamine biosynthesis lipoprotein